jgi:hypothetical protein
MRPVWLADAPRRRRWKEQTLTTIHVMTHASVGHHARAPRSAAARWRRLAVLAVTLMGLVFMHQLAAPPAAPAHHHAENMGPGAATVMPCEHPADCPDDPHGHPGQVCQAKPPSGTTLISAPQLAFMPRPAAPSALTVTLSTADHDAAGGSGCGPPGRAHLSIWRI